MKQFFKQLFCRHKRWNKGRFYSYSETHVNLVEKANTGKSPRMGGYGKV
jgi:hypothetical protein